MIRAEVRFDLDHLVGDIDRRIFGCFVEHVGRGVYTGIYEPGHPTADGDGFRQDVLDLVRERVRKSGRFNCPRCRGPSSP